MSHEKVETLEKPNNVKKTPKRCCCCCCCGANKEDDIIYDEDEDAASAPQPAQGAGDGAKSTAASPSTTSHNISDKKWNIAIYEDDDPIFNHLLVEAEAAIENEILPERIVQGTSGSYYVRNMDHVNIGVFKPKDEEPYGRMNPKWGKWFQRKCCPCCFGRGCLLLNSGYLSEAGASLVDMKLGLNVVPRTKVIRMASTTFHYGNIKRSSAKAKQTLADRFPAVGKRFHRIGLPLKIGSFQMWVHGYKDAIEWIQHFETNPLSVTDAYEFQQEFERMVILDYIIRNTDRGNENWLIRYLDSENTNPGGIPLYAYSPGAEKEKNNRRIKIAAIDNGLAFPFKHPDEWRAYPFHWAKLPFAKIPFSAGSRDKFLPLLSNIAFIEELCSDLYCLFSLDRNFQHSIFEKQMSVLRGQVLNLANALRDLKSPLQLSQMKSFRVLRATELPVEAPKHATTSINRSTSAARVTRTMKISPTNTLMFDSEEYKPEFPHEGPVFSSW